MPPGNNQGPDPVLTALMNLQQAVSALTNAVNVNSATVAHAAGGGQSGGSGGTANPPAARSNASPLNAWANQRLKGLGQQLGGRAGSSFGGEAAGMAARGGAAAGEGVAGALGAAAAPIAVIVAAAIALKMFHDAVVAAAKAQQAHNFQYANSSSAMAAVQVETEIADAFRDRRIGDATAGTAKDLADANREYDNTAASFEILWSNIKNMGIAAALSVITEILKPIAEVADEVSEWIGTEKHESEDMASWMDSVKARTEAARAKGGGEWFGRKF